MTQTTPKIRAAMTALAAVIALSSAPLLAQTAPETTPPATTATPVPDSTPAATTPSEPSAASASDPLAPKPTATPTRSTRSTTTHRTASVARPTKASAPVARAPVRTTAAAPAPALSPAPAESAAPAPIPVADVPAAPPTAVAATPTAQESPAGLNSMLPILGAVGLALLALMVIGMAMRNRRRRNEEELAAAEPYEPALDEAPAQAPVVATSDPLFAEPAFVATAAPAAASAPVEFLPAGAAPAATPSPCDDAAPGSRVEAACEGPTEDNPSLSIKKRIKRAQFFDQREQLAAAGMAVPVESDAGLPDALVEEPEPAPASGTREPA